MHVDAHMHADASPSGGRFSCTMPHHLRLLLTTCHLKGQLIRPPASMVLSWRLGVGEVHSRGCTCLGARPWWPLPERARRPRFQQGGVGVRPQSPLPGVSLPLGGSVSLLGAMRPCTLWHSLCFFVRMESRSAARGNAEERRVHTLRGARYGTDEMGTLDKFKQSSP